MVSHNPTRSKPTPQPVGPYEAWKPGAAADSSQQVADPTAHLSKDTVKALRGHEVPTHFLKPSSWRGKESLPPTKGYGLVTGIWLPGIDKSLSKRQYGESRHANS